MDNNGKSLVLFNPKTDFTKDDEEPFEETLTQFSVNNHNYSPSDEVKYLRKKLETMQKALDKAQEETRSLQFSLVKEKREREEVIKDFENTIEKKQMDFLTKLHSVQMEADKWKQVANSTTREVQLLHDHVQQVQAQKSDCTLKLAEIHSLNTKMDNHRRTIDGYLKRQKESFGELKSQLKLLQVAKNELTKSVQAQQEQISVFNVVVVGLDRDNRIKDSTIAALENEVLELKKKTLGHQNNQQKSNLQKSIQYSKHRF